MDEPKREAWKEHGFVLLLALLCAIVTILQFRWTGELAKAEFERLGGNQEEAARAFCEAFDGELQRNCEILMPSARDLTETAIARRIQLWQERNPRPIFRRLALAVPAGRNLTLRNIDLENGTMTESQWPPEWATLQSNLSRKITSGSPPYSDQTGLLFEFPLRGDDRVPGGGPDEGDFGVFDEGPGRPHGPPEAGWFIVELDPAYLHDRWLPDLTAKFLNPDGRAFHQIKVLPASGPPLFATGPSENLEPPQTRSFHHRGRDNASFGARLDGTQWILETRRQRGALEQVVATSRRRNLALAIAVNGLILAAGCALVRQTRKSRQLAEEQMHFVANVSHELRTPLTVIRGAAHNLKRGIVQTPEALDRYSGMILHHADQLSEMVQQVLDFSATRKAGVSPSKQPVPVERILNEALANTASETAGCEIEVHHGENLPMVAADEPALRRAFQNLISNAAKHGNAGAWIGIRSRLCSAGIEIRITDRGQGIPKVEQGQIFKPFFRGAAATAAQIRGSGIGLGLVKQIIEAHGGAVVISSEDGQGASFTVSLPVIEGGAV